jgi:hypothetical protein
MIYKSRALRPKFLQFSFHFVNASFQSKILFPGGLICEIGRLSSYQCLWLSYGNSIYGCLYPYSVRPIRRVFLCLVFLTQINGEKFRTEDIFTILHSLDDSVIMCKYYLCCSKFCFSLKIILFCYARSCFYWHKDSAQIPSNSILLEYCICALYWPSVAIPSL